MDLMAPGNDPFFAFCLIAAGVVAGCATMLGPFTVERFGGVVGGVVGTLPLPIIPFTIALLFFETTSRVSATLDMVPAGMLGTLASLLVWRFLPHQLLNITHFRSVSTFYRLAITFTLSVAAWIFVDLCWFALGNIADISSPSQTKITGLVSFGLYTLFSLLVVWLPDLPVGDENVSIWQHLSRFFLGFLVTSLSILFSKYNIYAGGITIAFPAACLTSLSSLWIAHSETVAMGAVVPMIAGSSSTSIYALVFSWVAPVLETEYNKGPGLLVAFAATWYFVILCYSVPVLILLRSKELKSSDSMGKIIIPHEESRLQESESTESESSTRISVL